MLSVAAGALCAADSLIRRGSLLSSLLSAGYRLLHTPCKVGLCAERSGSGIHLPTQPVCTLPITVLTLYDCLNHPQHGRRDRRRGAAPHPQRHLPPLAQQRPARRRGMQTPPQMQKQVVVHHPAPPLALQASAASAARVCARPGQALCSRAASTATCRESGGPTRPAKAAVRSRGNRWCWTVKRSACCSHPDENRCKAATAAAVGRSGRAPSCQQPEQPPTGWRGSSSARCPLTRASPRPCCACGGAWLSAWPRGRSAGGGRGRGGWAGRRQALVQRRLRPSACGP